MGFCSVSARQLCLHNPNAQCVPIWVSRADGLKLVHFQTVPEEMASREPAPVDQGYESCERECLEGTRR
jgi:hypothetical protein